jgi:cytochrome c
MNYALTVLALGVRGIVFGSVLVASTQPVLAAGDAVLGAKVFSAECAECHSVKEGKNKKGPTLFATLGRKAATQPGFEYSDELRRTGWTWSQEALRSYLSQPTKKANPGSKMKYEGLSDSKELEDLISYLGTCK